MIQAIKLPVGQTGPL